MFNIEKKKAWEFLIEKLKWNKFYNTWIMNWPKMTLQPTGIIISTAIFPVAILLTREVKDWQFKMLCVQVSMQAIRDQANKEIPRQNKVLVSIFYL